MPTYEKSVDVSVPVSTAYNQWTQFEEFPRFMDGVRQIEQLDDTHLRWHTEIAGVERSFDTEITEQHPDERVAWCTTSGPKHAGVVTFHRLDENTSRVHVQMEYEPEGAVENVGAGTGMVGHRLEADLDRFKEFIESRRVETGAWRGDVAPPPQYPS